ncbi:MAG: hypothetical protein IPM96_19720 [Ignavibacteria bacterium]|nr:hypothetical protein [Ignavibacteria bacterium]
MKFAPPLVVLDILGSEVLDVTSPRNLSSLNATPDVKFPATEELLLLQFVPPFEV